MFKSELPRHDQNYGSYLREDGEAFEIVGMVWDCPAELDYWSASYVVTHLTWGVFNMALIIPKTIAATLDSAIFLAGAGPLEQVKSEILKITEAGKTVGICPSDDSWRLVG